MAKCKALTGSVVKGLITVLMCMTGSVFLPVPFVYTLVCIVILAYYVVFNFCISTVVLYFSWALCLLSKVNEDEMK